MAHNPSNDFDQHDPKVFRETLGTFGTTTNPSARNQLEELQTKVRQGVKHVEIHLMNSGKGQFNINDVPDKYGFEQRRTIMQLAKLNQQTLSVHGDFSINSFSGLSQRGFDEVHRAKNMKEIDETLKFAAETAKGGAVVFHLHETGLPPTAPGEINLPDWYLEELKQKKPGEYNSLMNNFLNNDSLNRQFVDNPDLEAELKVKFENLSDNQKQKLKDDFGVNSWKEYYDYEKSEQIKLEQDGTPLVVVGSSITRASRGQDLVNVEALNNLSSSEKEFLNNLDVDVDNFTMGDFQKLMSSFTNGIPKDVDTQIYNSVKDKVILRYENLLKKNHGMQSKTDKEFFQKQLDMQILSAELQKKDLKTNYIVNKTYLGQIQDIEKIERQLVKDIELAEKNNDENKINQIRLELNGGLNEKDQEELNSIIKKAQDAGGQFTNPQDANRYQELQEKSGGLTRRKLMLMNEVGQLEYQKLERYDEGMAQANEQIKKAREQKESAKVLTDEIFEKNASSIGHLGLKALRYQLDLKSKSEISEDKLKDFNSKINKLEKQMDASTSNEERSKLNAQIQKLKYDKRLWVGLTDYDDIDVVNRPLYLAPENIMAGYGYMDSLEEYKGVIRTAWKEFAQKILSNEGDYKKIREDYEQETGIKVTKENAMEIAKKHIGGTFDNAHAGVWLKYFKRKEGESEEHRIERFNQWLNGEAESMVKEGIVKHIHFNDTQAKDDDHNLLGSGILDIHDLRERLRNAGVKEALIVEAGGRGGNSSMHLMNAFDVFNPNMFNEEVMEERKQRGYAVSSTNVSDWISASRDYIRRPQYSQYGMSYNTFRHTPPQQGQPKGEWSGTGFL